MNFISFISNELYTFYHLHVQGYIQRYSLLKNTTLFYTCHHNLNINVALNCSLLVIAVMDMPYKTHIYTCARLYKYKRKTYLNFLNIIQSEPLHDLWTYSKFYVKYMYLLFSAKGNQFRAFLWPYENFVVFFLLLVLFGGGVTWVQKTKVDLWN